MPLEETPPNSTSMQSTVNDNQNSFDDDNDFTDLSSNYSVIEFVDEDEATDISLGNEVENVSSESDGEVECEMIPEKDDANIVFAEHQSDVLCCAFHPKSKNIVVTGGTDDNAFVWDSSNGNKLFLCKGHEDSVEVVSFSYDGSFFATADLTGIIKVWRTKDFFLIETFELNDDLSWMLWHSHTNVLIASSQIGMIFVYKIPSGERKIVVTPFGQNCTAGKILPDGKSLTCGYKNGNLKIVDLKQGVIIQDIKPVDEIGAISCIDINKNNLIICGCENGAILLINANSGKIASVLQECQNLDGNNYIEAVSFCKDLSYQAAASGSLDGNLIIWDIARQTLRHKFKFSSCVNHLVWHPHFPVLFTCHFEGLAQAIDAKAGLILKEYFGHQKNCLNMTLSSDGSLLLTTSEDKTARIFSVSDILN